MKLLRIAALAALIVLSGCPRGKRNVRGPELPIPTTGDAQARERFKESRARFERDGGEQEAKAQAEEFQALVRDYPDDPIVPLALLYAGMAALRAGDPNGALSSLDRLVAHQGADERVLRRGELFRGIAFGALGRHPEALTSLARGAEMLNKEDREERATFHAAYAEAARDAGQGATATVHYDAWYRIGRPAERDYALDRIREVSAGLAIEEAARAYELLLDREGPGAAVLGERLALAAEAAGDTDRAEAFRREIARARQKMGLSVDGGGDGGDPGQLGALVPLTGKLNRIGQLCLRGLALASASTSRSFDVRTEDSASGSGDIDRAVEGLANQGAIAAVGPFDGRAVERAAMAAGRLGLPLLSLSPLALPPSESSFAFHVRHSAEERARLLARYAYEQGARDFAIFSPKNSYGQAVGAAFRAEVERLGGTVLVTATYATDATSFRDDVAELKKPWQAVFVPDVGKRLELIAPALAAGNFLARPFGDKAKHGRPILLLSTAEAVGEGFARRVGRYTHGAALAPGFYADRTDARIADFVSDYEEQFGRPPTVYDAYAYDAGMAIRQAIEAGAQSRRQLVQQLRSGGAQGVTGELRFDAGGRRSDGGLLFVMEEVRDGQFELRAQRGGAE